MKEKFSVFNVIGTVLFFASFIPYAVAVFNGFNGVFFGIQGFAWFYGVWGVIFSLFQMFLLIPGCIFIEIFFGRFVIRHFKVLKMATLVLVALLAVGTLASTVMVDSVQKARLVTDREQIEEYIADTFGEQYLAGAGIKEYSEDEEIFEVHVASHTYMVRRAQFGGFDWHKGCYEDYGED